MSNAAQDRLAFSEESKVNKLSTSEPVCMKSRPVLTKGVVPPLTSEEGDVATSALVNSSFVNLNFPKILRNRVDPPLAAQTYFIMCFDPSPGAQPDSDGCFGVAKIRGTFATVNEAQEYAETLVRTIDSYHVNDIGYVGKDFPIAIDNERYCTQTEEIDIRMKLDATARDNIKKQKEADKKEMEEINERHKNLLADTKKDINVIDIEYYTTLKQKVASMRMMIEECQKKEKEASKVLKKSRSELSELDERHPQFTKEYEEKYKQATINIGGDKASTDKMISYMK